MASADRKQPGAGTPVDRRRVLSLCVGGSTLGAGALLGLPVAEYLRPQPQRDEDARLEIASAALAPWEGRTGLVGGRPAVVVVRTDEGVVALSAVCTHLGCIVKWKPGRRQLFCPCHGARFGLDGRVLGGPAPRPLDTLAVEEREGVIVVRKA